MNDLIVRNENNLPTTIEDLSKFILVGREKLISVRAEIRAIDKLNLAQKVRNQKKEECLMLSEALLDAEVRLGDLLKPIPKAKNQYENANRNTAKSISSVKPKHEVIKELGFSKDQANRFETLANNKDLVEQVKQEARERDDIPTRSRVLELAKQRKQLEKKEEHTQVIEVEPGVIIPEESEEAITSQEEDFEQELQEDYEIQLDPQVLPFIRQAPENKSQDELMEYYEHLDFCAGVMKKFLDGILGIINLDTDKEHLEALLENFDQEFSIDEKLEDIELAIRQLEVIKIFLKSNKKLRLIKG